MNRIIPTDCFNRLMSKSEIKERMGTCSSNELDEDLDAEFVCANHNKKT